MAQPVRQELNNLQIAHKIEIARRADGVIVYRPGDSNQIVWIGGPIFEGESIEENPLRDIEGEPISVVTNPQFQPRAEPYPIDFGEQNMALLQTVSPGINVHVLFREDELSAAEVASAATIYGPNALLGTLLFITSRKIHADRMRVDDLIASIQNVLGDLEEQVREQQLVLSSVTGIQVDSVLNQGNVSGTVTAIDGDTVTVQIDGDGEFGEGAIQVEGGGTVNVTGVLECPPLLDVIEMICDNLGNVEGLESVRMSLAALQHQVAKLMDRFGPEYCERMRVVKEKLVALEG